MFAGRSVLPGQRMIVLTKEKFSEILPPSKIARKIHWRPGTFFKAVLPAVLQTDRRSAYGTEFADARYIRKW
jgi:hypothetical protein